MLRQGIEPCNVSLLAPYYLPVDILTTALGLTEGKAPCIPNPITQHMRHRGIEPRISTSPWRRSNVSSIETCAAPSNLCLWGLHRILYVFTVVPYHTYTGCFYNGGRSTQSPRAVRWLLTAFRYGVKGVPNGKYLTLNADGRIWTHRPCFPWHISFQDCALITIWVRRRNGNALRKACLFRNQPIGFTIPITQIAGFEPTTS